MPEHDTMAKPKKYFFDLNNFNDDFGPEPEVPPPPVFSQEELDGAQKSSYDRGKRDGLAEAKASRDKQVADLVGRIAQNFSTLFAAEDARMSLYESETICLARAIFERLFPGLNERHGLAEVERVIMGVLESHRMRPEIVIEVAPDYVEPVRISINEALKGAHGNGSCAVEGNPALGPGDCRMRWNDGGAERGAARIAGQIAEVLEQTLADRRSLRDNGGDGSGNPDSGDQP